MLSNIFLTVLLVFSPIWPLGENPLVGDPYIIINKSSNQLAFVIDGEIKNTYPVATGASDELTPEGEFNIIVKAVNPYYRKKNIVGGAKENPLGTRWMGFDANDTNGRIFGIHGNNNDVSIGKYVTAGCVRMYNEDIEQLFLEIPLGTKVFITKTDQSFEDIARQKGAIH